MLRSVKSPRRRNTASTGLDRSVDHRLIEGIEEVLQAQQASRGVNRGPPTPRAEVGAEGALNLGAIDQAANAHQWPAHIHQSAKRETSNSSVSVQSTLEARRSLAIRFVRPMGDIKAHTEDADHRASIHGDRQLFSPRFGILDSLYFLLLME